MVHGTNEQKKKADDRLKQFQKKYHDEIEHNKALEIAALNSSKKNGDKPKQEIMDNELNTINRVHPFIGVEPICLDEVNHIYLSYTIEYQIITLKSFRMMHLKSQRIYRNKKYLINK